MKLDQQDQPYAARRPAPTFATEPFQLWVTIAYGMAVAAAFVVLIVAFWWFSGAPTTPTP